MKLRDLISDAIQQASLSGARGEIHFDVAVGPLGQESIICANPTHLDTRLKLSVKI